MRDARQARWRGQAATAPEREARRGTLLGLLEKVWSVNKTLSPVTANSRLAVSLFLFLPSFWCGTQEWNSGSVYRAGGGRDAALTDPKDQPGDLGGVGPQHGQL